MLSMFIAKNAAKTGCKSALSHSMTGLLKNILPKKVVFGFSLVELLMALLVASLLMAALAPVMTRKIGETLNINGSIDPKGTSKKIEIDFNSNSNKPGEIFRCDNIVTETDGSKYCEGEFIVPNGYNGIMKVTVIGAGGGGGTAPTAGYVEYTNAGSTNTFTVPDMVNKLEATLIGGGAGGGAGGMAMRNHIFVTNGNGNITQNSNNILELHPEAYFNWTIPDLAKNQYVLVTACGGGGGGGGAGGTGVCMGGGGGSGGYYIDSIMQLPASGSLNIHLGGGGGGGGADNGAGRDGRKWDAGGGGSGINHVTAAGNGKTTEGGAGGYCLNDNGGYGGKGGIGASDGQNGVNQTSSMTIISGGSGNGYGGKGGDVAISNSDKLPGGGGGGGGYFHGGGGGGAGGGSGGGGGGPTLFGAENFRLVASLVASGGGGGGGGSGDGKDGSQFLQNQGGGGGGGAGVPGSVGGNGGNAGGLGSSGFTSQNGSPGLGGKGGNPGLGATGGQISTIFGNNYCSGGDGGKTAYTTGSDGKDGAMKISYIIRGPGGSGGGSGRIHANYPVSVVSNEVLGIIIGRGGHGGTPGSLGASGKIAAIEPERPANEGGTYIKRNDSIVLGSAGLCGRGGYPGSSNGTSCGAYTSPFNSEGSWIHTIDGYSYPTSTGHSGNPPSGFYSTNGRMAGDIAELDCDATPANGTIGGRGGNNTTPYTGTCTPGAGGTLSSPEGKNASGYGCGGGGGYGLAKGGNGSGGYARLAWNMYWDAALNSGSGDYQYTQTGSGGGGASGNVMTHTVSVISGQTIRIRIGQGGVGAKVENNSVVAAVRGGDTVFGDSAFGEIRAGGGGGGISPSVSNTGVFTNGKGGSISNVCHYKSKGYLNNANYCIKGKTGNAPLENSSVGGVGANFAFEKISGIGGAGGRQDSGENSNGGAGSGIGAGGGGAAIRKFSNGIPVADALNNPNKGGQGANGKIIIEWWE